MIRCLAIDDEPLALKQVVSYISKIPYLDLVGSCRSAAEAAAILDKESVDAMFVDINMPDRSGMDFVKSLTPAPMVVFTTAYSEYAVEGYKVDAVDYLLKPFSFEDFRRAAERVKANYEINAAAVSSPDADNSLFFKTDYKIVRVNIDKIVYVEGMSEYLKIFVEGETEPVVVLLSLKKLEDRLPADRFMRIHKSYILNLSKIREVSKGKVFVSPDVSIPIGDLYKDAFNSYLESKFMGR